jgi:tetratricopeptide (TPR) repeat protein
MRALAKEPDKRHESVTLFTKTLLDEYEQVSGEKPDRTQFEAVKPQPVEKVISEEDRKKKEHYAFLQKGIAFYNQKNYEEALVAFEQAIQLDPKGNFAWYCKGVALNNLGRHEEAIKTNETAIQLNPKDATAWHHKGVALSYLGRHEEAIKAYETAIQLDPKDAEAWHNKGSALSLLGRHEEALAAFKKVEELDPSDRDAKSSREVLEEIIINKSRQGNFKSLLGR